MYNLEKKSWNIYHHNFTWKALRKTEVKPNACSQVTLGMIWEWEDLEEIDKNTNEYNSRQSVVCAIISVEIKCDKSVREKFGWRQICMLEFQFSSVQFSHSVVSNSLRPYGLQQARPPCPSPTPGVDSNSCPLSR